MLLRLLLFLFLLLLIPAGSTAGDNLLNGTNIYIATGDSFSLYQGYILTLKSVSSDGSVWLQLSEGDKIVKSEIAYSSGYFTYTKADKTIVSVKVDKVYSGSSELVSLSLYQFIDPDMPAPKVTEITPKDTQDQNDTNSSIRIHTPVEPVAWALGILLVLALFYAMRKLW